MEESNLGYQAWVIAICLLTTSLKGVSSMKLHRPLGVTHAEAAATECTLAADAEAYQVEVTSKARAEAIRREAETLKGNEKPIQLRLAESWNG